MAYENNGIAEQFAARERKKAAPREQHVDQGATLRTLINGRGDRLPGRPRSHRVASRLDNHGVDLRFCTDNQALRTRYQRRLAGHPGR